jgi:hypothetical protein
MLPNTSERVALNWASIVSSSLSLLTLYFIVQCTRTWYRLRHFKGPLSAKFSKLWLLRHVLTGRLHLDLAEVTDRYGASALNRFDNNGIL